MPGKHNPGTFSSNNYTHYNLTNINNTSSSNSKSGSNSTEARKSPDTNMNRNINILSQITKKAMSVQYNKHNGADSIDDKRVSFGLNNFNTKSKKELFIEGNPDNYETPITNSRIKSSITKLPKGMASNTPKNTPFSTIRNSEANANLEENIPQVKKYIAEKIIPNFSSSYNLVNNNNSSDQTSNYASSSIEEALNSDSPQIINIYNINNNYNIGNITYGIDKESAKKTQGDSFGNHTICNNTKYLPRSVKSSSNFANPFKAKRGSFINIAHNFGAVALTDRRSENGSNTNNPSNDGFSGNTSINPSKKVKKVCSKVNFIKML